MTQERHPDLVMAVDAGTGSCRAIVFDLAGRVRGSAQREWTHPPAPDAPGGFDFDTATNGGRIDAVIREAIAAAGVPPEAIRAVAASSLREGIVLFDEDGRALWACPNIDSRAGAEARALAQDGRAARIFEIAGDWVSITTPARLLWLEAHRPDVLAAARRLGLISDWIAARLCGRVATEPTSGSSTAMFDLATRSWSREIIAMCGVDPALFPDVVETGTPIGTVTREAAARCGLAVGTPVVAGGGDTQLALLGLDRKPGEATLVGGSFWQFTAILDEPVVDPRRGPRTLCHALPGQWMIEGIGFLSGLALRWCRDAFWPGAADAEIFRAIEAEAGAMGPGANGVTAIMASPMRSDSWVHAAPALVGFDLSAPERTGRGAAARAIMEAAAYVSACHRDTLETLLDTRFETVTFTGGSAQGGLLPHIVADVLGVPVDVPQVTETTALGAAILAAAGGGLFPSVADAARAMASRRARTIEPDRARADRYATLRERWARMDAAMLDLALDGVTEPMWRAAGALPRK